MANCFITPNRKTHRNIFKIREQISCCSAGSTDEPGHGVAEDPV